ncbi:TPA_asm: hypothetical protein GYP43_02835 [Listeria monocytogenes]|nr:hypothetical protein [Listeria monocytogenes]
MFEGLGTMRVDIRFEEKTTIDLTKAILEECKKTDLTFDEIDRALVLAKQELGKKMLKTKLNH